MSTGSGSAPSIPSPQHDHGYDVADYCDVDPVYGDLAEFDRLVADAHRLGLKLLLDIVPNHCSSEHPWFREALAAGPGSAARARFHFADGRGPDGDRAAQQLARHVRRTRLEPGHRARRHAPGSGTCTCSRPSSPT